MNDLERETIDAMLVSATDLAEPSDLSVASRDDLERMDQGSEQPQPTAANSTERCTHTCGGCRG